MFGKTAKTRIAFVVMATLFASSLFTMAPGAGGEGSLSEEIPALFRVLFDHQVAYTAGDTIDGVEVADFDPDHPGLEIVSVDRTLKVVESYYQNGSWISQTIWQSQGQMLTPAVGDLIPHHPGEELIVVGISSGTEDEPAGGGITTLIYKDGNSWRTETIFQEDYLIHGATVGDLIPHHPGEEAVVTSFSGGVYLLWYENNSWNNTRIYLDSGKARKAVIDDFIPEKEGNELAIVAKSGNLSVIYREEGDWRLSSSWNFTIAAHDPDWGFARIASGDADGIPGKEIYGATDGGTVYHVWYSSGTWQSERIFQDSDSLRGVWVGDVDPSVPGPEIYSFGYSKRLVEIWREGGEWKNREIFRDSGRGHEIRIADAIENVPGPEIYIVGYSRNATCIGSWLSGASRSVNISLQAVSVEEDGAHLKATIVGEPLPMKVALSVECDLSGSEVSLSSYYLQLPGEVEIYLSYSPSTQPRTATVTLRASPVGSSTIYTESTEINIPKGEVDTIPPEVEGTPEVNTRVGEIIITFSENISESSVERGVEGGRIYLEGKEGRYNFSWEVRGSALRIYDVEMGGRKGFKEGDRVVLHVEGVEDLSGNPMAAPYEHEIKVGGVEEPAPAYAYLILIVAIIFVAAVLTSAVIKMKRRGEGKGSAEE
ncbi:MAG: hypothetical protein J7K08_01040 [Thermoplasmata archaeon]|nr:hypothetical protein [Thermoplasmata archaeon]